MEKRQDNGWIKGVVARNIQALLDRQRSEQARVPVGVRLADRVTRFTGSLGFVLLQLLVVIGWIVCNLPSTPFPKFDRHFIVLAMVASVEAIFLSTFVLITQNRMSERSAKRADLDLQVSLLAEHEVTQLIALVRAIAARLEVKVEHDPELAELEKDVEPEQVLDLLEKHEAPDVDQ
ncbi:MAG TPA: DUF1003 domain-containing protein [Chthoniobacterales bacterium]|nr:DUF1003 domain-containing protein [Chthoniobacterales bacterium]